MTLYKNGGETWVVVGASRARGIGLEFVNKLLQQPTPSQAPASQKDKDQTQQHVRVVAAVQDPSNAPRLYELLDSLDARKRCVVEECDVSNEDSLSTFAGTMQQHLDNGMVISTVVLNAGILQYPNRATEVSFSAFAQHLHTNTIGPIICAQKLLELSPLPPQKLVFISSDSGSTTNFLSYEDGFAAYAASKAALNQMLRHMAAELARSTDRRKKMATVLALHPGEVQTDMANVQLGWQVQGQITPAESVSGMMKVIAAKGVEDSGTFWCWDGRSHPW
ncbi:uncharacterized protein B0I36DRAFT_323774 [Microdochium trichocladiopsis]|uniref:NAD(P)-binding protein n=1 Tax=Microdochium trichocladiopsis TaxID=1682393 RepID=A0A9P8Y9X2_9PEZI|nr:uncharacterized protein B0I36DRAFT_323774 [Microdochium trichocladiopsis]KAH7031365.1 hypothetical protein B0I36DRAFT_323774 [Microdochium trichocladiopsis]